MNCVCGKPITREDSFETPEGPRCAACFMKMAAARKAPTGEDLKRLKALVKEELAGLLPRDAIKGLIEEGYSRLVQGVDFDEEVGRLMNEIERMAGLALCRQMLEALGALSKTIEDEIEEVRAKMRRLAALTRQ